MSVTAPASPPDDPVVEMLKQLADPVKLKSSVKRLREATEKYNSAIKALSNATSIAKTIKEVNEYVDVRKKGLDELKTKHDNIHKKRGLALDARETSISRREGAFTIISDGHNKAVAATRTELSNRIDDLEKREAILVRGQAQLVQDNYGLRQEQKAVNERRTRLMQALKG